MDGHMQDGHNAMTIARWPSASGAKKRKCWLPTFSTFLSVFVPFTDIHLTLYQTTFFRLVQIESLCRGQFNLAEKLKFVLGKIENIVGKGESAGYPFQRSLEVVIVW